MNGMSDSSSSNDSSSSISFSENEELQGGLPYAGEPAALAVSNESTVPSMLQDPDEIPHRNILHRFEAKRADDW